MKKIFSFFSVLLMAMFCSLSANAQVYGIDKNNEWEITTSATWFSSPYTDTGEGSLAKICDGQSDTYWHSAWGAGRGKYFSTTPGTNFIRIDFPENFFNDEAFEHGWGFKYIRRSGASNDHMSKCSVWGIPKDADPGIDNLLDKDALECIGEFEFPYNGAGETCYSGIIESKEYTSIAIYAEETSPTNYNRGYFHIAELQILGTIEDTTDPRVAKLDNLMTTFNNYMNCFQPTDANAKPWSDNVGDGRWQYKADLYQTFEELWVKAGDWYDNFSASSPTPTAEEIDQLNTDLKAAHDAVLANIGKATQLEVTPGYYMIVSSLPFQGEGIVGYYTAEEADAENVGMQQEDENGSFPGDEGYIPTYPDGYTLVKEGDPKMGQTTIIKAIYDNNGVASWKTFEKKADFLFKIEKGTASYVSPVTDANKVYKVTNMMQGRTFGEIKQSAQVNLVENDSLFVFDIVPNMDVDGNQVVTIRNAGLGAETYRNIHCNGHGGGTGTGSNIVGWEPQAGASQWYLYAITDAEAEEWLATPERKLTLMTNAANKIATDAPAQIAIAKDIQADIDEENPLITEATQFHSPQTTDDEQTDGDIEAVYPFLLDGNTNTYWHSAWENGNQPNGTHYIQISGIDAENIAFKMTRRPSGSDHITTASVYGYAEANDELAKDAGALLAEFPLPYKNNTEVLTSPVIKTQGYKVIRIYAEATTNNRGYWHMSEFQMYPATVDYYYGDVAKTQYTQRKAEADALTAALDEWNAIEEKTVENIDAVTAAYDKLAAAWEAWSAVYADPTPLRAAIAAAEPKANMVVVGNNPGEWSEADGSIKTLVDNALAYDQTGKYNADEITAMIEGINSAEASALEKANKVKTGKWYRIKFATEAQYEANGWDKTGAKNAYAKYDTKQEEAAGENEDDVLVSPALFGKYIAAGQMIQKYSDEVIRWKTVNEIEESYSDSVVMYRTELVEKYNDGTYLIFTDDESKGGDAGLFRFVEASDSTYYIQNKATGLYVGFNAAYKAIMTVKPYTFMPKAAGFGANFIYAYYLNGEVKNNIGAEAAQLHGERATGYLVGWDADEIGSNSMMFIEEAEDVAAAPATNVTFKLWPGTFYAMTLPCDVEITSGDVTIYNQAGNRVDDENKMNLIQLKEKEGKLIKAGEPVILQVPCEGEYKSYANYRKDVLAAENESATLTRQDILDITTEEVDSKYVEIGATFTDKFTAEATTGERLIGHMSKTLTVDTDNHISMVVNDNGFKKGNCSIWEAYIAFDKAIFNTSATYKLGYEVVTDFTAIENVTAEQQATATAKAGIYNIAGQKLSKPVKGINIINGKKVIF